MSIVDNNSFSKQLCGVTLCRQTLSKYLIKLHKVVKEKIAKILPATMRLIIDGWGCGRHHFLGVYATCLIGKVPERILFGFNTLPIKYNQNTDNCCAMIEDLANKFAAVGKFKFY